MAITQHLREGHDLVAATLLSAGLFEVALSTNTLDDVLAFELLFQAAQGALNWLTFTDFDFDGHELADEIQGSTFKRAVTFFTPS